MSVETWKAIFDWGTVVLIGLTFVFGAGALITGNILGERQEKELAKLKQEAGKANEKAGIANERAEKLEASNIQLRIDLENAASESKRRQAELEVEQRKTAEAQEKAAAAQLSLVQTVRQLSEPRRIVMGDKNGDQALRQSKFEELEKYPGTRTFVASVQDNEAQTLALDIVAALRKAGWKAELVDATQWPIPNGLISEGVQVRTRERVKAGAPSKPTPSAVLAVIDLLSLDLGWPFGPTNAVMWEPDVIWEGEGTENSIGLARYGIQFPEGAFVITVGVKPTRSFFTTQGIANPEMLLKAK